MPFYKLNICIRLNPDPNGGPSEEFEPLYKECSIDRNIVYGDYIIIHTHFPPQEVTHLFVDCDNNITLIYITDLDFTHRDTFESVRDYLIKTGWKYV